MFGRIIIAFIANAGALYASGYFLPDFHITGSLNEFLIVSAILTAINLFIRPIIKLFLSPIIMVTLGLFNLVINGTILYLVDFYFENIRIEGLITLFWATVILTIANLILGGLFRKK